MPAKNIKGITIEIGGDTTKLESALKKVNTTIRTTNKELTDINKLLKVDPSNVELLKQKQDSLTTAINATKEKLETEKKALEQLKKQPQTEEVITQQERLGREIIETEQDLKKLETEYKQFGSVAKQQVQAAADKIGQIGSGMADFGSKVSAVGDKITTRVTLPIVAAGTAATASFADVDKTMQLVNKTMGNTTEEAGMLNDAMSEAAANSTFGMSDAATATLNFARAGLSAAEAANALAPAMNLAAGEGGNLETVSAGLVATINGFGDSFDQTTKYADIFAAACNNSALDVDSLSQAMSIAAPIFKAAGYNIEDAALYMGVMANAGIDANTAATSLKTGLAKLAKPAKEGAKAMKEYGIEVFNADGTMKDSVKVQKELHDAFAKMTNQEQLAAAAAIFGKNQMSNWLALINTAPEEVDKLSESLTKAAGTTEEMADAMMSGFGGSVEKLKSSTDVLMTSMGGLIAEYITPIIEKIQGAVDKLNAMDKEEQQQVVRIMAIVAALGPLLSIGGRVITGIGNILDAVPKITAAVMGMNPVILATVAVVGLLAAAYVKMATYEVEAIDHTRLLTEEQKALSKSAKDVADQTKKSADARRSENDNLKSQRDLTNRLVSELKSYCDENGNVIDSQDRVKEIVGELNTLMPELNLAYDEQTQALSANTAEIDRNVEAMLKKAETAAMEEQLAEIMKERIQIEQQMLQMEDMVAEAEKAAADAANEFHDAQASAKDISELSCYEYQAQYDKLVNLRQAQTDAALACSEATGPYYELQARLEELGVEEDYITDKIGSTNDAMGTQGDAAQALADAVDDATDEISSSWDDVYKAVEKSVSSQISLFDEYKKKQDENKDVMIKNAEEQVKALESWSQDLQELSKKGISEGLLQELAKMGPDGAAKVAAFNQMTEPELAKASQLFEKATIIPAETIANVEKNYAELGQKEHDVYNQAVENGVSTTRQKTINSWEKVGEGVPTGVIQAIEKEKKNVEKTVHDMDQSMIDTTKDDLQMHSPSKVYRDIGQGIPTSVNLGITDKAPETRRTVSDVVRMIRETVDEGLDRGYFYDKAADCGQAMVDALNAMIPAVEAAAARIVAAANRAASAAASVGGGGGGGAAAANALNSIMSTPAPSSQTVNNTSNSSTTNMGGVTISVHAAPGQNVNDMAAAIEDILMVRIGSQEGVFA